jgi:hypothetical protein
MNAKGEKGRAYSSSENTLTRIRVQEASRLRVFGHMIGSERLQLLTSSGSDLWSLGLENEFR